MFVARDSLRERHRSQTFLTARRLETSISVLEFLTRTFAAYQKGGG